MNENVKDLKLVKDMRQDYWYGEQYNHNKHDYAQQIRPIF
jgi:hypothetical protein